MADSRCRADGFQNWRNLHVDHDPPLRDEERQHRHLVEDFMRVGLLCASCHATKTNREQGGRVNG
jgi:hypothetical protein